MRGRPDKNQNLNKHRDDAPPDYYLLAVNFEPNLPLESDGHPGHWNPPALAMLNPKSLAERLKETDEKLGKMTTMAKVSADAPLSLKGAAQYLGVQYDTLYNWAIEKRLIGWYDIGQGDRKTSPRFYKRDLDAFVQTYRCAPVPPRVQSGVQVARPNGPKRT